MKLNKNAHVAIAIGWFVLTDILLSTTGTAVGTVSSIPSMFRGLIRGLGFSNLIVGFGIVALISIGLLVILMIAYIFRAWTSIINLTRILAKYFFFDNASASVDVSNEEAAMLKSIFGENTLLSKNALLWLALRNLLAIWIIVIIINIIASAISVLSAY